MEAILKAAKKGKISAKVAVVISNNHDAKGLKIANRMGIKTEIIQSKGFSGTRADYDKLLMETLRKHGVTEKNGLVCLAGFMRILSPEFIKKYKHRILNIHPALLPAFPGLHSQKQALDYGAKYAGCTVHFVDEGVDTGPIILQAVVPIKDNDTEESLSKRILAKEHRIYPEAVSLVAQGKVRVTGRKTVIKSPSR